MYNTPNFGTTVSALLDTLQHTPDWDRRWDILWYVQLCEHAGFADTDDLRRACAARYIAGKRKITSPGTKRRKKAAKEQRKLLANVPAELRAVVTAVASENPNAIEQYKGGNEKALNSMIGAVMKRYKSEPTVIRTLLIAEAQK